MNPQDLERARAFAETNYDEALNLLRTLARIPAPSHREQRRATFIRNWLHSFGLIQARIDEATNVICPIADDGACDLVVFAAHMDVVFPTEDELPLHEEDGRVFAPGVGDDTANLVALLLATRELSRNLNLLPPGLGALVVANSCEEGLGNLKGTKHLFATYGSRIRRFYSFDLYLPKYVDGAVGSHRWKLSVDTQGGHSFSDFGQPNAIERLCALIQALYALPLPPEIPCTINVGTIQGGTTVNAIAAHAEALFEYRSTSDEVLCDLREQVRMTVESFATSDVSAGMELIGERPASAKICDGLDEVTGVSRDVIESITGEEAAGSTASTDANVPLSMGIPANTIGAIRGALLHTTDEWIDAASLKEGLAVVLGIMGAQRELT